MIHNNVIIDFIINHTKEELFYTIDEIHPVDFLEALYSFKEDPRIILDKLPDDYVAHLIDYADDDEKFNLLSLFSEIRKEAIIGEMSSDELVDLLGSIDDEAKETIMKSMNVEDAEEVKELLAYDPSSAGGIMATEYIAIKESMTVNQTIQFLRSTAPESETPYYVYVVGDEEVLKGVVRLRDIIVSDPETIIQNIMLENIIYIPVTMDQEDVSNLFEKYGFMAMPVVDEKLTMLGIITLDDVLEVMRDEYTEDMFRLAGLDEEEKIDGSLKRAIASRLPWLLVNLITAILAAATVSLFEATIAKVVVLATFMPIVAGMGGNAGTQTLTMIIRSIALGELTYENQKKILFKEIAVGLINGLCLGIIMGLLGFVWERNIVFGLVIGSAMFLNLVIATISGYVVPLALKKIGVDPAIASAVFVTTVTDVLGFFFFLGLATLTINYLV